MQLRSAALAAILTLPLAALGGQSAEAAAYAFTSSGSFANAPSASISSNGTKLGWGGTNNVNNGNYNGSTMTAVAVTGGGSTPGGTVKIGELDWYNKATSSDGTPGSFTADYNLAIDFSTPAAAPVIELFKLSITNTANNAPEICLFFFTCYTGDVDDKTTLSGYSPSFVVGGLLISNITFTETGKGAFNSASKLWTNPEDELSKLFIYADITAVPEPVSLSLLGAGLVGLGLVRRRNRRA